MRRLGRVTASLGFILALAWVAIWFVGRSEIESQLDAGIDRIREEGVALEVGAHRVSGFPFAFAAEFENVTLEDPISGVSTDLPAFSTRVGLDAPDELITDLPERFTVTVPIDRGLRTAVPGLPPRLVLEIEAKGLSIALPLPTDATPPRAVSIQAEYLSIRPIGSNLGTDFALTLGGLDANGALGSPEAVTGGSVALSIGRVVAESLSLSLDLRSKSERQEIAVALGNAVLAAESDAIDIADLRRLLNGSETGTGSLTLKADEHSSDLTLSGTGTADGRFGLEGDGLAARFSIANGAIETATDLHNSTFRHIPDRQSTLPAGAVSADRISTETNLPLASGRQMRAIRLALDAEALEPDAKLWGRIDPQRVLARTPARAKLEIEGTGRFTKPPSQTAPGEALPLELGNLSLSRLEVDALGARAEGRGDVEFLQPVNEPTGALTLQFDGVLGLLRQLHEAGLITQESLQSLATLAAFYTRAGDRPDRLLANIAFAPGEIRVNGDRIR